MSIKDQKLAGILTEFASQYVNRESNKNSLIKTTEFVETAVGKKYSHMTISRWYKGKASILQEKEILKEDYSGYYVYDEQEVSAGGRRFQRLALRDLKIKQPIAEELAPDKNQETIRRFLTKNLENKPRKAMIVDGDNSYPEIITNDLKMDYQLDVRHLFENISKTFKDECAYGVGHKKLHLADELKKQEIFDIFYPRKKLLSFIKRGLKTISKIKDESMREEKDTDLQKKLLELKRERKKARRRKGYVSEHKNYTIGKARKKFEFVKTLYNFYPKPIQKLLDRIKGNWTHYTLFLIDKNVPPTSNLIEQYFSSTLQRSDKKEFRNINSLNEFIRLERMKKSGIFPRLITDTGLNFIAIIGIFLETILGL